MLWEPGKVKEWFDEHLIYKFTAKYYAHGPNAISWGFGKLWKQKLGQVGGGVGGTANNRGRALMARMFKRSIKDFDKVHKAFTGKKYDSPMRLYRYRPCMQPHRF